MDMLGRFKQKSPPEAPEDLTNKKYVDGGLAGKADASSLGAYVTTEAMNNALAGKSNISHTHTTAQVTGLDAALAGKAAATHGHAQADITGLASALAGKANTSDLAKYATIVALDAKITYGTTDLTPGTSPLATGAIYLVYE